MRWLSRLLRRNRVEKQLDAELRDHVERQVADYVAAGATETGRTAPGEPRVRRTRSDKGAVPGCATARAGSRISRRTSDTAPAIFRRNPSFAIAAVFSLALGIGASTAIFTLVDATMLKPLPVKKPEALVELLSRYRRTRSRTGSNAFSYQALVHLRQHATTVEIIASHESDFFVSVAECACRA